MDIEAERERLRNEAAASSKALQDFPRGPMGLISEEVRTSTEYQAAKRRYNIAADRLKSFNSSHKPPRSIRRI